MKLSPQMTLCVIMPYLALFNNMESKLQFAPHLLAVLGAALLALFFDARPLVWVLSIFIVLAVIAYEFARYKKLTTIFFGLPLTLLFLGAWELFAVVYGMRALQLTSTWFVAFLLLVLSGLIAFVVPYITALGRGVLGVLLGLWALTLLFAPASFFALGIGAAGAFVILSTIIYNLEMNASSKVIIMNAIVGPVLLLGIGFTFRWFL